MQHRASSGGTRLRTCIGDGDVEGRRQRDWRRRRRHLEQESAGELWEGLIGDYDCQQQEREGVTRESCFEVPITLQEYCVHL